MRQLARILCRFGWHEWDMGHSPIHRNGRRLFYIDSCTRCCTAYRWREGQI